TSKASNDVDGALGKRPICLPTPRGNGVKENVQESYLLPIAEGVDSAVVTRAGGSAGTPNVRLGRIGLEVLRLKSARYLIDGAPTSPCDTCPVSGIAAASWRKSRRVRSSLRSKPRVTKALATPGGLTPRARMQRWRPRTRTPISGLATRTSTASAISWASLSC